MLYHCFAKRHTKDKLSIAELTIFCSYPTAVISLCMKACTHRPMLSPLADSSVNDILKGYCVKRLALFCDIIAKRFEFSNTKHQ